MPDYNSFVYDFGALYTPKVISSKCYAHFRMSFLCYNGTKFGFDWLRNGDTDGEVAIDIPYCDIVGANYKKGTNELETNGNVWDCNFRKDEKAYKRLSYTYFPPAVLPIIPFKDHYYAVPVLSLYPFNAHGIKVTASLALHIYIKESVKEMHLDYNKEIFDIECDSSLPVAKNNQKYIVYLNIKCNKGFNVDQFINVMSVDKKGRENLSGMLRVWRNSFIYQKKMKIAIYFVDFIQEVVPKEDRDAVFDSIQEKVHYLWHALIRGELNVVNQSWLKGTDNSWLRNLSFFDYSYKNTGGLDQKKIQSHFWEKINNINSKYTKEYDCVIFYFNRPFCIDAFGNGNPAFAKEKYVFTSSVAKAPDSTTMIHEILHTRGLKHTFNNEGKFTFKSKATDNLMDYSANRVNWLHWQWQEATRGLQTDK